MFGMRFSTAVLRYPSGKYGVCGSVPIELCKENQSSKVWDTEQEVIDALLSIGMTHFQKADCTWYDA